MNLDLTSVFAKLTRSREHAQTIHNEVQAWMDRNPYGITKQVNADSTRYSLLLREIEAPPFLRWTLIFADAINNLRTALDHLVQAIAIAESGKTPPPHAKSLHFPITDSRLEFDERVRTKKLGDISDPVRAVFESLQPYNRPHPTLPPLLRILRDLNNTDKHRLLRLAYGAIAEGNLSFVGDSPADGRQWQPVTNMGEVKDGTEIFAMVCDRPTPNMHWDLKYIQIIIAIWHDKRDPSGPDFTSHTEFAALLKALTEEVQTIIFTFTKV